MIAKFKRMTVQEWVGFILSLITLGSFLYTAYGRIATKDDVERLEGQMHILRMELTIKVNEAMLMDLEAMLARTPAQDRQMNLLIKSNERLTGKIEHIVTGGTPE